MTKMTDSTQRNSFSEGLAIGLLARDRLPLAYGGKGLFELAIEGAFRSWSYAGIFPRINYLLFGPGSVDGLYLATHAKTTRLGRTFWWTSGYPLDVEASPYWDWDNDELEEAALRLGPEVPLEGWVELADAFLTRLDRTL